MKTSLSERYVAATIAELPADMHDDVRAELEASIADAIVARVSQGEDHEAAEHAVLTDLGDPSVLAASYTDRPLHLIGPRYYLTWWRLLKRLLYIIPPIVFVISAFAQVLAGASIGTVVAEAIVATISTILHVCFWTTLAFAVIERSGEDVVARWKTDDLPQLHDARRGKSDMIASLIFLGLALVALLWDQTRTFIRPDAESISVLNPDLWPWAMVGLIALILLEATFALVLYTRRGWTIGMACINTALNVVFFSWFITLLTRGELFSAEFLQLAVDNGLGDDTFSTLGALFGFGVAVICVWDIIEGWIKTYRTKRSPETINDVLTH